MVGSQEKYTGNITDVTPTFVRFDNTSTCSVTATKNKTEYTTTNTNTGSFHLIKVKLTKKEIDRLKSINMLTSGWNNPKKINILNRPKEFKMKKVIRSRLKCNKKER